MKIDTNIDAFHKKKLHRKKICIVSGRFRGSKYWGGGGTEPFCDQILKKVAVQHILVVDLAPFQQIFAPPLKKY